MIPVEICQQLLLEMLKLIHILLLNIVKVAFNTKPAQKDPEPYHTSILSGHQWVLELIAGHPDCIHCELRVRKETFLQLLIKLCQAGHCDSKRVTLEEQLAIFLYMCVTGLTMCHVGKHFQVQCSSSTISWYFYTQSILRSSHLTDYLVDTFKK